MPSQLPSFALGYHGCGRDTAEEILSGNISFLQSRNPYDWLGHGAYFWESDPHRAWEWAVINRAEDPYVIGAVIDYGNCLNLLERNGVEIVIATYEHLASTKRALPENKPGHTGDQDKIRRDLDCYVIEAAHEMIEAHNPEDAFDTVRGMFPEGESAYPGAGFKKLSHIQLCVRKLSCIRGCFRPVDPATGKIYEWSKASA